MGSHCTAWLVLTPKANVFNVAKNHGLVTETVKKNPTQHGL